QAGFGECSVARGLDEGLVDRLAGKRRDQRREIRRLAAGHARHPDRLGRSGAARAAEVGELPFAIEKLRRARRGIAEVHPVPGSELQQVGAGFEFGFEQQLLLLERDDAPLGPDHLAGDRMHLEVQHQVQHRANRQRCEPADATDATLRSHAASPWWARAGAAVRTAQRSVAERARGLRSVSASDGRTAFDRRSKVGVCSPLASGKWRLARAVAPAASRKKRLTIRSSRLWKLTTAKRPPALSSRSAARKPCSSSSSSPFTWIRMA